MRNQEQISSTQAMKYVISTVLATAILFVPGITAQKAAQDAWLSLIIAMIFGVFVAYMSSGLGLKFPNETIIQFSVTILGKPLGKFIGFIYVFYFFYVAYFVQRQFGELMNSVYMVRTPMLVFIIIVTLLSCYVIYKGLEVLVRVNDIIIIWMLIGLAAIFILTAKDIQFVRFLPVFDSGLGAVIRGSFSPASWLGESAIIMMLIPFISDKGKVKKANVLAVIFLFLIMELIILGAIGVLGVNFTQRNLFPMFSLARNVDISYAPILERQEAVFMVIWVAGMLMKLSTFFYAGVLGLSQWLNICDYRPVVLPMGVIITSLSILSWDNLIDLQRFSDEIFSPSIIFVNFFITSLLYIASIVRMRA
ncbi:MAG: endospore germination permease [Desulfotomaculaceae bacterium]|nr:endospore germination permease [Desulfotomaculaceae bacterium]